MNIPRKSGDCIKIISLQYTNGVSSQTTYLNGKMICKRMRQANGIKVISGLSQIDKLKRITLPNTMVYVSENECLSPNGVVFGYSES